MGASTSLLPVDVDGVVVTAVDEATYSHHQARSLQGDKEAACSSAVNSPQALVRHERSRTIKSASIDAPSTRYYERIKNYRSASSVLRFVDSDVVDETTAVDDFVDDLLKMRESWTLAAVTGLGQRSLRDSRDDSTTMDEEGISGNGSSRSSMAVTRSSNENVHRETLANNLIVRTLGKNNNSSIQHFDGEKIYRKIVEGAVAEGGTGSSSSTTDDYLTNNRRRGGEEDDDVGRSSGRIQMTPSSGRRNGTYLMPPKGTCKRDDPPNIMFHQRQLQQRQHRHQHPQRTSNNRKIDTVKNSFDEWSILSRRAQHYKQLLLDSNKASLVQSQSSTPLSPSESGVQDYIRGVLLRQQQHESMQMRHRHAPSNPIPSPTNHYDTNPSAPTDPPSDHDSIVELQNSHHSRSTSMVSTSSLHPHSRNEEIEAGISHILSEQSRDRRRRYKEMLLKQSSNNDFTLMQSNITCGR